MKRYQLRLSLTSVIVLVAVGVLLPVMLSTAAGIVALVFARDAGVIIPAVLVISFTAAAAGGALITVVLASKKAWLARRQADFVANVSHELRTPLSAIRLYAQTLQSGRLEGDREQTSICLAAILRETEWLDVMIDKVLTWRASAGDKLPLEMKSVPVTKTVEQAVERFRTMISPGEASVSLSLDSILPVRHDPPVLSSVVLNLLTNAYKYTNHDKMIGVSARDENGEVVIEVRDNGIGLPRSALKDVFRPFYRAVQEGAGERSGVGLGLAIAHQAVTRHGGRIDVSSREGAGSTFSIRLPADPKHGEVAGEGR